MVDVREAVKTAQHFLTDMYPEAKKIRLEEVELLDNEGAWDVVLSFPVEDASPFSLITQGEGRLFKHVKINVHNGEPLALKVFKQ